MRLIFMGTPDFALVTLKTLQEAGHEIVAVYSQPPRAKGRGHKVQQSPVQRYAQLQGWPVYTPQNFNNDQECCQFANHKADSAIVVAYGLIQRNLQPVDIALNARRPLPTWRRIRTAPAR